MKTSPDPRRSAAEAASGAVLNRGSDINPLPSELRCLLAILFGVSEEASEEELLESGRKFAAKLAAAPISERQAVGLCNADLIALSQDLELTLEARLSDTDRRVCKILGLKPSEFLKI